MLHGGFLGCQMTLSTTRGSLDQVLLQEVYEVGHAGDWDYTLGRYKLPF